MGANQKELVWTIGGMAGDGIMVIGAIFARAITRSGLNVFDYAEFPSLIRGGHNVMQVRAANFAVRSQSQAINCLVALNLETIELHAKLVKSGGVIVYDANETHLPDGQVRPGITYLNVPFLQIAREVAGERLMLNTVALGASAAVVGLDLRTLRAVIRDMFAHKGLKVVDVDLKCAEAGFNYIEKHYPKTSFEMPAGLTRGQMVMSGIEAISMGAIKAGLKFYSAYPMTPASGFLSYFADVAEDYKLVVKQTEDEIAAINMAVGAGYAGVRAMTATSGGGFSLMVEALGLAGMTETPLVVIDGMRGGPSTGLPTWTEQGDLLFIRHAGQGEFPRVVMAPGDVAECFEMIGQALNLAETYQLPVIVLIDKYLAESHASISATALKTPKISRGTYFDDRKHLSEAAAPRYAVTPSGISPRLVPGISKAIFNVSSDEHDECGAINEEMENRVTQMTKRMRKMHELEADLPKPVVYGDQNAHLTIIGWGSSKGPILDAIDQLQKHGTSVNYLHINYIHPFPTESVKAVLSKAKRTLMIEGNYSGQLEAILKQETLHSPDFRYRRFDGRPFYAEDIIEHVHQSISHQAKVGL